MSKACPSLPSSSQGKDEHLRVPPTGALQRRRLRVVLVEDDHDVRDAIASLLACGGYEVLALCNGSQLLEFLDSSTENGACDAPADVIVTDVRMPGSNGLQVVESLRSSGWNQPVVLLTAFGDDGMRERVARMKGVTLVDKPFEPATLEALLAHFDTGAY